MKRARLLAVRVGKGFLSSGFLACAVAALALGMSVSQAGAETINFSAPGIVNTPQVYTLYLTKAWCDGSPDDLTQVTLTFGQQNMQTNLNVQNTGEGLANYTINSLHHDQMKVEIPGTAQSSLPPVLPNKTGQLECMPTPPCPGPAPGGDWQWLNIAPSGVINVTDAWHTTASQKVVTLNPGDPDFAFFKGASASDTFPVTFTVQAGMTVDYAGTWSASNETFASASVSVEYTCAPPPPPPSVPAFSGLGLLALLGLIPLSWVLVNRRRKS